jgi:Holliday junction resolvase RusA-like endonuclease
MNITIPVEPTAKGRARVCVRNGRSFAYTPAKTAKAEKDIRAYVESLGLPMFAPGVPLRVGIHFYLTKPKSVSKKRQEPVVKPDLDNYVKIIDSLNGVIWPDDSQICGLSATKEYGQPPRIELEVTAI